MGTKGNLPEIQNFKIAPVILAGGMGKRLRPLTNENSPKSFLRIFSKNSLFQNTVLRVLNFQKPIIVCHKSYLEHVLKDLSEINVTPRAIILEPYHKGTAAAIAMAAFYLKNRGEHMLVLPSDHVLGSKDAAGRVSNDSSNLEYKKCFEHFAMQVVKKAHDKIVLIGASPSRVETGYGYILHQDLTEGNCGAVKQFIEKPDHEQAARLLKQGQCLWNTGMFVAKPRVFLQELKDAESDIYDFSQRAFYAGEKEEELYIPAEQDFIKIPAMSIDYAMMERGKYIYVSKIPLSWSDVGTWPQIMRLKLDSILKKPILKPISQILCRASSR